MIAMLTKEHTRIMFISGTIFSCCLFLTLVFDTLFMQPQHDLRVAHNLNMQFKSKVTFGKLLWEQYNCEGCHRIIGEGANFAPELSNIAQRYSNDPIAFHKIINHRLETDLPVYRTMPEFDLTENEISALIEFLVASSKINTRWHPYGTDL
ncbi:hypothetical protein TI03_01635 [Achromatium sp. WMS1]|nr:hypothetical protein TI03_01635 [Achromatium sp. WMS1]